MKHPDKPSQIPPHSTTTDTWYQKYYQEKGADRNDLLRNPEVFFQRMAMDLSIVSALRDVFNNADIKTASVLDVGCGTAESIVMLLRLGLDPEKIYGVDIMEERVLEGKRKFPNVNFLQIDARNMSNFEDGVFDIACESTMFIQLTDETLSQGIAGEMLRVVRQGGYILLTDWRYSKPFNPAYKGLTKRRIEELFQVGKQSRIVKTYPGALLPPIGRFLSRYCPSLYFLLRGIFPFLVGQKTTIIQKV